MFRIRLKEIHDKKGATVYRVAKDTGLSITTVRKYAEAQFVDSTYIPAVVASLCDYYGVNWRDPLVIEFIEDGGK